MAGAARRARRLGGAGALAAIAVLLAACATPGGAVAPMPSSAPPVPLAQLDLVDDPRAHEGPSTAVLADPAIPRLDGSPEQSLPATVISHDLDGDRPQTVVDASRVLALDIAGSIAATVVGLGLGESLVARDSSSTFEEVAHLPVVTGGGHAINIESVLAAAPSVVVTDGSIGPVDVVLQLRDAGIPVVFVQSEPSLEGVAELARQVGAALGAPQAGVELADRLAAAIDDKIAEIAAIAPTDDGDRVRMMFLYIRGSSGVYYLFGGESGADVLIEALGGVDVASELGWSGMRPITDEALIAADPDLILVMTGGLESAGGVDGLLAAQPAVALTRAGENRRFVDMADGEVLGFGPRTAAVLDALARAVYAPAD